MGSPRAAQSPVLLSKHYKQCFPFQFGCFCSCASACLRSKGGLEVPALRVSPMPPDKRKPGVTLHSLVYTPFLSSVFPFSSVRLPSGNLLAFCLMKYFFKLWFLVARPSCGNDPCSGLDKSHKCSVDQRNSSTEEHVIVNSSARIPQTSVILEILLQLIFLTTSRAIRITHTSFPSVGIHLLVTEHRTLRPPAAQRPRCRAAP